MKKAVAFLLVMILSCLPVAFADDLGVQIIGGEDKPMETLNLDDMKLGASYRIDGYAIVKPISFDYYDSFAQYQKDMAGDNSHDNNYNSDPSLVYWDAGSWYHIHAFWNDSGTNAEFAWLLIDITNLQKSDVKFLEETTVKVVFDDEYEFAGWMRQFNHDYRTWIYRQNSDSKYYIAVPGEDGPHHQSDCAIDPSNEESIGQMYTGSYVIGCTLPNAVVDGKEPLRIEIKLGENELTYHIRK